MVGGVRAVHDDAAFAGLCFFETVERWILFRWQLDQCDCLRWVSGRPFWRRPVNARLIAEYSMMLGMSDQAPNLICFETSRTTTSNLAFEIGFRHNFHVETFYSGSCLFGTLQTHLVLEKTWGVVDFVLPEKLWVVKIAWHHRLLAVVSRINDCGCALIRLRT